MTKLFNLFLFLRSRCKLPTLKTEIEQKFNVKKEIKITLKNTKEHKFINKFKSDSNQTFRLAQPKIVGFIM